MKNAEMQEYIKVIAKEIIRIGKVTDSHTNALSTIMQSMSQPQEIKLFESLCKKTIKTLKQFEEAECK